MKFKADGKLGAVSIVPPDPGDGGCVLLELIGGDSYSVRFAPGDGEVTNKDGTQFKVKKPTSQGTCVVPPTTTTSSRRPRPRRPRRPTTTSSHDDLEHHDHDHHDVDDDHHHRAGLRRPRVPARRRHRELLVHRRRPPPGRRGRLALRLLADELDGALLGPVRSEPSGRWSRRVEPRPVDVPRHLGHGRHRRDLGGHLALDQSRRHDGLQRADPVHAHHRRAGEWPVVRAVDQHPRSRSGTLAPASTP